MSGVQCLGQGLFLALFSFVRLDHVAAGGHHELFDHFLEIAAVFLRVDIKALAADEEVVEDGLELIGIDGILEI